MTKRTLREAKSEAKRFLRKVDSLEKRFIEANGPYESHTYLLTGCAESGAVKRSSMDLTRALAELRKSYL